MNTVDTSLAYRLRMVREYLCLDVSEMADEAFVAEYEWESFEGGVGLPDIAVLDRLWGHDINLNWLVSGEGEMLLEDAVAAPEADARPSGRIGIDLTISSEDIALIAKGIKALVQAGKAAAPESEGPSKPLLNGDDPEDLLVSAIIHHVVRQRGFEEDALDAIKQLNIPLTVNRLAAVRACILLRRPA